MAKAKDVAVDKAEEKEVKKTVKKAAKAKTATKAAEKKAPTKKATKAPKAKAEEKEVKVAAKAEPKQEVAKEAKAAEPKAKETKAVDRKFLHSKVLNAKWIHMKSDTKARIDIPVKNGVDQWFVPKGWVKQSKDGLYLAVPTAHKQNDISVKRAGAEKGEIVKDAQKLINATNTIKIPEKKKEAPEKDNSKGQEM